MTHFLILLLAQFSGMIRKKSLLFGIGLLSLSFSLVGILFYSGYFLDDYYKYENGSRLQIQLKDTCTENELISIMELLESDTDKIRCLTVRDSTNENESIIGQYNELFDDRILTGISYSISSEEAKVLLPEYMVNGVADGQIPIGRQITIENHKLSLCGIISFNEDDLYLVPVNYYIQKFPTDFISCNYNIMLSKDEYYGICNELDDVEGIDKYKFKRKSSPFTDLDFLSSFFQIFFIFLATTVNAFLVLYYWLFCFKKDYSILAICGAGEKKVKRIIIGHAFIFIFLSIVIGNFFYYVLMRTIQLENLIYKESYIPYCKISLCVAICLLGFSSGMANRYSKNQEIYRTVE